MLCPNCKMTYRSGESVCRICGTRAPGSEEPKVVYVRDDRGSIEPRNPVARIALTVFLILLILWLCGNGIDRQSLEWFMRR